MLLFLCFIVGGLSGFTCIMCQKWFTSSITLTKHRIWHHKETLPQFRYNCHYCPYGTNNPTNFKKHYVVHSEDRAFKCKVCYNRFASQASLNQHLIIHVGENKQTLVFAPS